MGEIKVIENPNNFQVGETHYLQVDILKAIMIFLVIFDHTISWVIKDKMGVELWERISIPVFLVIMGFNIGHSFKRMGDVPLIKFYSKVYFKRKFWRYIWPFLILYVISTIIGLCIYEFNLDAMINNQIKPQWNTWHFLMGILPFWGPGNWFIPIVLQSIIFLPIIYKAFSKKPILSLLVCFIVEIAFHFIIFLNIGTIDPWEEWWVEVIFRCNLFFYLSAIGLGMWFSIEHKLESMHNIFMLPLIIISIEYLIAYQFLGFRYPFVRGDYSYIAFPYSAFLFLLAMKILPQKSENSIAKAISWIGKSTYHILLTQILYLGIIYAIYGDHYCASIFGINRNGSNVCFLSLIINWVICIPLGVFWWYCETRINKYRRNRNFSKSKIYDNE